MLEETLTCFHCDGEIRFANIWEAIGRDPWPCPHCGRMIEIDWDEGDDGQWFALVSAEG